MAIAYCEHCHDYIDIDWNVDHFNDQGECFIKLEEYDYAWNETYTIEGENAADFNQFEEEFRELLKKYGYKEAK